MMMALPMSCFLKVKNLVQTLALGVLLAFWGALFLSASFASAQTVVPQKTKAKPGATPRTRPAIGRAPVDITASLQAQAIAEAAARSQKQVAAVPSAQTTQTSSVQAVSAVSPSQPTSPANTAVTVTAPNVVAPAVSANATVPALAAAGSTALEQNEQAIAERIHLGDFPCEMGAHVRVEADASEAGYFYVQGKGFRYRMYPARTTTGALRLEDKNAGAVWLQLANKSMLMDQKKGRRLADECAHPAQTAYVERMKKNPPPSLIDVNGLGR